MTTTTCILCSLWKVWAGEAFHKQVEHDRACESSPKKHYSESFGLSAIQVSMNKDTPWTEKIPPHAWGFEERSFIIKVNIWESEQSNDCTDQTLTIQRKYSGWLETLTAAKRCSATTEFGDLEMLGFAERWKPEFSVQSLSGKGRESTNGSHICCHTETLTKGTHYW